MKSLKALLLTLLLAPFAFGGTPELIEELKPLLKKKIIGTSELRAMQRALLQGELINPVELGVGPEPEMLRAHDEVQQRLDTEDVDYMTLLQWLNTTIMERENTNVSGALRIAQCLLHGGQPITPFAIIRHVARVNLAGFIRAGLAAVGMGAALNGSPRVMTTSCSNTAIVLPFIFLGFQRASLVVSAMRSEGKVCRAVSVKQNRDFKFRVVGLFDGLLPSNVDERLALCNRGLEQIGAYISQACGGADDFDAHMLPQIMEILKSQSNPDARHSLLSALFSNVAYCFNRPVIERLRAEIHRDSELISDDLSMLYVLYAKMPSSYNHKQRLIQHAFIVEMFLLNGKPHFRLFQSWVNRATLLDNLTRQRLAKQEIWDAAGFEVFLRNLEQVYCEKMDAAALWHCFGYGQAERPMPLLSFDNGRLKGVALAYLAAPFNPKDAIAHLAQLMNCGLDL